MVSLVVEGCGCRGYIQLLLSMLDGQVIFIQTQHCPEREKYFASSLYCLWSLVHIYLSCFCPLFEEQTSLIWISCRSLQALLSRQESPSCHWYGTWLCQAFLLNHIYVCGGTFYGGMFCGACNPPELDPEIQTSLFFFLSSEFYLRLHP